MFAQPAVKVLLTHQLLQDPPGPGVAAVVRQDPSVDQNQAVEEHPGAEPEQSEDQGPLAGAHPQAQPVHQRRSTTLRSSSTRQQTAGEHGCIRGNRPRLPEKNVSS